MVGDTTTSGGSGSPTTSSHRIELPGKDTVFNDQQCLFCNKFFGSFDSNVSHMQTAHGLFIPNKEHLIVDLDTLFSYLHLVIFVYNECICCGIQRNTTLAVQHHMLGKGHCKFDIDSDDSEYADFYDFSESEEQSDEEEDADIPSMFGKRDKMENLLVQPDESSLRLPSGRIISNRSQPRTNPRRKPLQSHPPGDDLPELLHGEGPTTTTTTTTGPDTQVPDSNQRAGRGGGLVLTRAVRQENRLTKQLATLRAGDEKSLAHLSVPEQRAVLAIQQKQVEKAHRAEERYRGRVEGLGNRTLMTHFVKDAADKRTLWK